MKKYQSNIRIDLLHGDKGYQRRLNQQAIEQWSKNYKSELLGVLTVSRRRDGKLYVVDGQHRLELLKILKIEFAPCMIIEGLTPAQEAELFIEFEEKRKKMKAPDIFNARVFSGHSHYSKVSEILKQNGFNVRISEENCSDSKIKCIVSISKMAQTYGYDILDNSLNLINAVWPKDKHAIEKHFLDAISKFILLFSKDENFSMNRVIQQFKAINPQDTILRARGMKLAGRIADNIVDMLLDVYNQRLRIDHRLIKKDR